MQGTEKPLSPKEVSINLGIGDSTLRKWCLALEAHEYFFPRTDNNRRVFYERDVVILRHLRQLIQVQNFTLENASLIVVSKFKEDTSLVTNTENSVPQLRDSNEIIEKLMSHIEQQETFNKQLLEKLEEQQKYIEERLNKRDELLMESLKQSQETKRLLLEAQEEQKKKRKGLFSFFSKD
ncbi:MULTISPECIES: DUF3967 domain-containing protein [Bacillus]|uniref:DUF3967 domain-containing protein n=1 Tax=Bacillus TaxID=1386 RepID=UPI0002D989AA|nr:MULTISPECIES: DUF3967 domain-containing protein [Bacillus]